MRAIEVKDGGLILAERVKPAPAAGEVLIEVHAAGVTADELNWEPTTHTRDGRERQDAIPGHEFSGIVVELGEGILGFAAGDAVFGMNDWYEDGATAEFCIARPASLAHKPANLSHVEAASVPIPALTAWQGLIDRGKVRRGERVLVHGGAGGVGLFAVQIAHAQGAHVVATASSSSLEFVRSLGVDEVIDYHAQAFDEVVAPVDVVFDTVGGDTLERSWGILKPGGRLVTIAADVENSQDPRMKDAFFIVEPKGDQLAGIARQLEAGSLKTFLKAVVPFDEAPSAYTKSIPGALPYGKVVVSVRNDEK
ncbi:MAG TPA: NADP-dependent oxidoreductase [Acidobacteriaceae bacterium]|jgi:NADPH:quinone reductase-like Zn-dependent oxidoreductase